MRLIQRLRAQCLLAPLLLVGLAGTASAQKPSPSPATYPALPSETPAKLEPAVGSFDHVRRKVMIPMRDGVKLLTVILVPSASPAIPRAPTSAPSSPATTTPPT